jgi:predicted nucleic acid-binding protein
VKQTFADSFFFLALFNGRDAAHKWALAASKKLEGALVTTDWILVETADALCSTTNRARCAEFIDDLRSSQRVEVESSTRGLFDAGWELYKQRADKDWSLTDCISFVVMRDRGIADALTGDRHFEQAGFKVLFD